jgi:hypothetical protein
MVRSMLLARSQRKQSSAVARSASGNSAGLCGTRRVRRRLAGSRRADPVDILDFYPQAVARGEVPQ